MNSFGRWDLLETGLLPIGAGTVQSKLLVLGLLIILLGMWKFLLLFPNSRWAWTRGWVGDLMTVVAQAVCVLLAFFVFCVSFLVLWPQ